MNALIPAVERRKASSEQPLRCALDMNTSSVLPAEQFDFFRSWYAGIAEVTLFQEECSSFLAHQMVWDFGKLTFIYLTLPYCQFGWRHLSRPTIDNWCLTLLLPKAQNSRDDFEVGDLGLQSFADPFECISKKNDFLAFVLPRNLHFMQSSKIEIRRNSKQLLTDYMLLLHRSLPDLRSTDALNIAAATTSLLAACLAPSRDRIAEAQRPIEAVLMNRASQIIAKRLSDPKLTPDLLCREIGVSRSGLYRIFESVGGVANYIRRARLRKTRDALADSSDGRSIFTIAEQCGFMDPSTYSRMFKKEFGISPRDARAEGCLNVKFTRPTDRTPTLRNLLLGNYWDRSNDVDRL